MLRTFGLLAVALGLLLLIGANSWVAQNQAPWRYGILPFFLILIWPGTLIRWPARWKGHELSGLIALTAVIALVIALRMGPPSFSNRKLGLFANPQARALLSRGCGVIAGDYWKVWPMVTAMNQLLHEEGVMRPVLGYSTRAEGQGELLLNARAPQTRWCELK